MKSVKTTNHLFLPNFCDVQTVFLSLVVTELIAFVLVLMPLSKAGYHWDYVTNLFMIDLALVSLFMQWITLSSIGLLCALRSQLNQLNQNVIVGFIAYLLILMVTLFVSELAWQLNGLILFVERSSWNVSHPIFLFKYFIISAIITTILLKFIGQYQWIKKNILALIYVSILMFILILCEWISFFQTTPQQYPQAVQHHLFLWRNFIMSAIISAILLRYFYVQYLWKQETEMNAYTRVQALQARIRPHFLFNSMNTIASLIRFQPKKAEQAVEDFAELFRASLAEVKICKTFKEELILCHQYLRIEFLRLGERLQIIWDVDCIPDDAQLPPFCLQPLLENAVYHGIQPLPEGGTIKVIGQFNGAQIQIKIENPVGCSHSSHHGHRIAQQNIQQRLHLFYGSQAQLEIQKQEQTYFVRLTLPYKT